jgi:hypothetical protein
MVGSFVLGVIVGAGAMWLYGRDIVMYVDEKTRDARTRVAETLQSAAETLQGSKQPSRTTAEGGPVGGERRAI